jgi:hypothetical protein
MLNLPLESRAEPRNFPQVHDVQGIFDLSTSSVDNFVGKPGATSPKA